MRSFIRFIVRRSVVLPQPDGPMSAVTSRARMSMETSLTARNDPYQQPTVSSSRTVSRSTAGGAAWGIGAILTAMGGWGATEGSGAAAGPRAMEGSAMGDWIDIGSSTTGCALKGE